MVLVGRDRADDGGAVPRRVVSLAGRAECYSQEVGCAGKLGGESAKLDRWRAQELELTLRKSPKAPPPLASRIKPFIEWILLRSSSLRLRHLLYVFPDSYSFPAHRFRVVSPSFRNGACQAVCHVSSNVKQEYESRELNGSEVSSRRKSLATGRYAWPVQLSGIRRRETIHLCYAFAFEPLEHVQRTAYRDLNQLFRRTVPKKLVAPPLCGCHEHSQIPFPCDVRRTHDCASSLSGLHSRRQACYETRGFQHCHRSWCPLWDAF